MHCLFVFSNLLKYNGARRIVTFIHTNEISFVDILLCAFPKVPHPSNSENKRTPEKSHAMKCFCFVAVVFKSIPRKNDFTLTENPRPKGCDNLGNFI